MYHASGNSELNDSSWCVIVNPTKGSNRFPLNFGKLQGLSVRLWDGKHNDYSVPPGGLVTRDVERVYWPTQPGMRVPLVK
jgi:hypothetical protein